MRSVSGAHAASIFPARISATILTKNSEPLLAEVLAALGWCDEVVVLGYGLDRRHAGDRRVVCERKPAPAQRAVSAALAAPTAMRWPLGAQRLDPLDRQRRGRLAGAGGGNPALPLDRRTVYTIPFQNYYNGKHITTCGWAPDRHERLFNRTATNFCTSEVHERVQTAALAVVAPPPSDRALLVSHGGRLPPQDVRLFPACLPSKTAGRKNPARREGGCSFASGRFSRATCWSAGSCRVTEGLTISAYKSQVVFWKYLMLHEANRRSGRVSDGAAAPATTGNGPWQGSVAPAIGAVWRPSESP